MIFVDKRSLSLTIFIPSFDRQSHLKRSLLKLLELIPQVGIYGLKILVGNNGSRDETIEVISQMERLYHSRNICFNSFSFEDHKGLGEILLRGLKETDTKKIVFLSDDDEPTEAFLDAIYEMVDSEAPIAISNFAQPGVVPRISKSHTFRGDKSIEFLRFFASSPKFSGLCFDVELLKSSHLYISGLLEKSDWWPHVLLAYEVVQKERLAFASSAIIATTRNDYVTEIRFPLYVGAYFGKELSHCFTTLDPKLLDAFQENLLKQTNSVFEFSIQSLFELYYGSNSSKHLTMFADKYWDNVVRKLKFKTVNSEELKLGGAKFKSWVKLFLVILKVGLRH